MRSSLSQSKPNTYATFVDPLSGSASGIQDFSYKKNPGIGVPKYNTHATFVVEETKPVKAFTVKEQGGFSGTQRGGKGRGGFNNFRGKGGHGSSNKHGAATANNASSGTPFAVLNKIRHFTFQLTGVNNVLLTFSYELSDDKIKQDLRTVMAHFDPAEKGFRMTIKAYATLLAVVKKYFDKQNVVINEIPSFTQELTLYPNPTYIIFGSGKKDNLVIEYEAPSENKSLKDLPEAATQLYEFQKRGIEFGIKNKGRLLIADEMGVGKTLQALCISWLYRKEWPLLIVCPATLRLNWKDEIMKWFGDQIEPQHVIVLRKGSQDVPRSLTILICSYELASKKIQMLDKMGFRSFIADEAHYLKNATAKRSQLLVPFFQKGKRVILLTGTPAFAKPKELFNLCTIIRPDIFKNFKDFGQRYCDPKPSKWTGGIDYDGCQNVKELHFVLSYSFMIRRLKKDVLCELPAKTRQKLTIECDESIIKEVDAILTKLTTSKVNMEEMLDNLGNLPGMLSTGGGFGGDPTNLLEQRSEIGGLITKVYKLTGMAKVQSTVKFIKDLLENEIKFLVFAHHVDVLDSIQENMEKSKTLFVRIDGQTDMTTRHENVRLFENNPAIRVALLSLTAASQGITMTSATTVVFAEIHWTPAIMIQAEDRCHRITQRSNVTCFYLYGDKTLDYVLYEKVKKKFNLVSTILDGERMEEYEIQEDEKPGMTFAMHKDKNNNNAMVLDPINMGNKKNPGILNPQKIPFTTGNPANPATLGNGEALTNVLNAFGARSASQSLTQSDNIGFFGLPDISNFQFDGPMFGGEKTGTEAAPRLVGEGEEDIPESDKAFMNFQQGLQTKTEGDVKKENEENGSQLSQKNGKESNGQPQQVILSQIFTFEPAGLPGEGDMGLVDPFSSSKKANGQDQPKPLTSAIDAGYTPFGISNRNEMSSFGFKVGDVIPPSMQKEQKSVEENKGQEGKSTGIRSSLSGMDQSFENFTSGLFNFGGSASGNGNLGNGNLQSDPFSKRIEKPQKNSDLTQSGSMNGGLESQLKIHSNGFSGDFGGQLETSFQMPPKVYPPVPPPPDNQKRKKKEEEDSPQGSFGASDDEDASFYEDDDEERPANEEEDDEDVFVTRNHEMIMNPKFFGAGNGGFNNDKFEIENDSRLQRAAADSKSLLEKRDLSMLYDTQGSGFGMKPGLDGFVNPIFGGGIETGDSEYPGLFKLKNDAPLVSRDQIDMNEWLESKRGDRVQQPPRENGKYNGLGVKKTQPNQQS